MGTLLLPGPCVAVGPRHPCLTVPGLGVTDYWPWLPGTHMQCYGKVKQSTALNLRELGCEYLFQLLSHVHVYSFWYCSWLECTFST